MKIAAIETSGRIGSVAMADAERVLEARRFTHGRRHAVELLGLLAEMAENLGWKPDDLDYLFLSIGPGSFTGLRIGVSLAKTLSLTCGVKLIAVPTVDVLARNAPPEAENIAVILDAKRRQVYAARFHRKGDDMIKVVDACLTDPGEFIREAPRPIWLLGEGVAYHREALSGEGILEPPPEAARARAEVVVELGRREVKQNRFADPAALIPLYIRPPEAEEKWQKKR